MQTNNFKYSIGNRKIGKDTIIFNMHSATDCISAKLGLCQLCDPKKCYALKAERMYKQVLPFRREQQKYWDTTLINQKCLDVYSTCKKHKNIKYIRFNESGDITSQKCIDHLIAIANAVNKLGIILYGYTARKDLNYDNLPSNLIINGSNFMLCNSFVAVNEYSEKGLKCKGACSTCKLCKVSLNKTIEVLNH